MRIALLLVLAAPVLAARVTDVTPPQDRYLALVSGGKAHLEEGRLTEAERSFASAFKAAPYAAHLPIYLVDHPYRDGVIRIARRRVDVGEGEGSRILLAAVDPDPRERLAHRRILAGAHPTEAHFQIWKGVASLRASLEYPAGGNGGAERDQLEIEALESFVAAYRLEPTDDRCYEGLVVWIPERGCLYELHTAQLPQDLVEIMPIFRRVHCALGRQAPLDPLVSQDPAALAREALERLKTLDTPPARLIRGIFALHLARYREATEHLAGFAKSAPDSFLPNFTLGRAHLDLGELEKARDIFEGLQKTHVEPALFHNLALIEHRQGRRARASELYESALAIHPDSVPSRYNLALCHLEEGRRDVALALVEEGLASVPDNPHLEMFKGMLLAEEGRYEQALPLLERSVQGTGRGEAGLYSLAMTRFKLGQLAHARHHLADLLVKSPLDERYQAGYRAVLGKLIEQAKDLWSGRRADEARALLDDVVRDSLLDNELQGRAMHVLAQMGPAEEPPDSMRAETIR